MRMVDIIDKKRKNIELTAEEIHFFVDGYTKGEVPDYQASALLMAICFNGMNDNETYELTMAMADSGERIDLSSIKGIKVDKHSTGGVGDKTTLIVGPVIAACGLHMAKMSGRGLGFTGGTADKLNCIPGYKLDLDIDSFIKQVNKIGISVIAPTLNIAPADKKMYALRDVTATVECMPLIASSIMSKKLAAGADVIVLDVKCGNGAFMKNLNDALKLAEKMVDIGTKAGRKVSAVISDMNEPLGCEVGNTIEVAEAVRALKGDAKEDLMEDVLSICSMILLSAGKVSNIEDGREMALKVIKNGDAYRKFVEFVFNQGGDVSYIDDMFKFGLSRENCHFKARKNGYITGMDTEKIGRAACVLGAGREKLDDKIDFNAGITFLKKYGDKVSSLDDICILRSESAEKLTEALTLLDAAIKIEDNAPLQRKHVLAYVMQGRTVLL